MEGGLYTPCRTCIDRANLMQLISLSWSASSSWTPFSRRFQRISVEVNNSKPDFSDSIRRLHILVPALAANIWAQVSSEMYYEHKYVHALVLSQYLNATTCRIKRSCMYACLYVCISVCLYVYMSVCLYVYMSVCLYVCMSVRLYVRMSVRTYVCMYVCTNVRTYVCMYVRTYVCMYVMYSFTWMFRESPQHL